MKAETMGKKRTGYFFIERLTAHQCCSQFQTFHRYALFNLSLVIFQRFEI